MAALVRVGADGLLEEHRPWLEGEVRHYLDEVVDPVTGMVRADRKYSAHRDTVVNRCNAFGNSMVALLAMTLVDLGWDVPDAIRPLALAPQSHPDGSLLGPARLFRGCDRRRPTVRRRQRVAVLERLVVADALSPATSPRHARSRRLREPVPLKYEPTRNAKIEPWFVRTFMPDYQGSTVWTSLGSMYMQLLHSIQPQRARLEMEFGMSRGSSVTERSGRSSMTRPGCDTARRS